jgi:hypothetical protein
MQRLRKFLPIAESEQRMTKTAHRSLEEPDGPNRLTRIPANESKPHAFRGALGLGSPVLPFLDDEDSAVAQTLDAISRKSTPTGWQRDRRLVA